MGSYLLPNINIKSLEYERLHLQELFLNSRIMLLELEGV